MSPDPSNLALAAVASALDGGSPRPLVQRLPRRPRPTNVCAPSPLRPTVLAEDRILLWTTPFASRRRAELASETSPSVADNTFRIMVSSLERASLKNYGAGLLRFTQFCDSCQVSEDARMPASDSLLASFVADAAGAVSMSTVNTWIAGLSFWHTVNGAPWLGGKMLRAACGGAMKRQPDAKAKRPPVTLEHLHALRDGLDLANSFDAAVYAVACVAFWSCRRCVLSRSAVFLLLSL